MASGDAGPVPKKNTAYRVTFPLFDNDGDLVTGAAGLDSEVSKDGAAFADCTNEATEIASSSGIYYLDLTAAEMNADTVVIIVKTSTVDAKTTPIVLYPEEAGDIRVDVTQLGSATQSATDLKDFADAGYDPSTNKVQGVVLCDTTTTNSDMRGTDSAATAAALATVDSNVDAILVDTGTTLNDKIDVIDGIVDAILLDTGTDGVVLAANAITAAKIDSNAITDAKIASGAITAAKIAANAFATGAVNADFFDKLFNRKRSEYGETEKDSLAGAIASLLDWSITGLTRSVKKEGGTEFFTQTLTGTSGADPITSITVA
tara:strand:- start:577 stop:1530 length:954 start_codon:yes stop_codon:yes gene_type:complete